ncbi:hypothetical protein TNCV_1145641 [Trichonephila clavipes]|nr:hypothetical protein TNCV_1145641 [Trichonephila clavipes]
MFFQGEVHRNFFAVSVWLRRETVQEQGSGIESPPFSQYATQHIHLILSIEGSPKHIAAPVGRDPMTISRVWNRWVEDGNRECRARSQRPPISSSRACYTHGLNGSWRHATSTESRIGVICKTINICTNSWTTFATLGTLSSEIKAAATLDAASQTGASSMM